jgi:hypothetical protein
VNTKTMNLFVKKEHVIPLHVTGFTETNGRNATFSSETLLSCTPAFKISPSFPIDLTHDFTMENPTVNKVTYTLESYALDTNCWGYAKNGTFSRDYGSGNPANPMRVGNYNGSATKAWIPFTIDFGTQTGGIKIVSAKLVVNLFEPTVIPVEEKPCKIKFGVDKTINPVEPTNWASLNAKIMSTSYGIFPVVSNLEEGYTHEFDFTALLNDVFGVTGGIVWNNGEKLAIILQDFGSYTNEHIAITSFSGQESNPNFTRPKLVIVYENIYYGKSVLSAWISSGKPNTVNFKNTQLFIGEPNDASFINRSLLYINFASIPPTATITNARLDMDLYGVKSSTTTNFQLYKMLTPWDAYTVSWNKKNGTETWTTSGGFADCDSTPIINEALELAYGSGSVIGHHYYDLTSVVQYLISHPDENLGWLIKTSIENNDGYSFFSSWASMHFNAYEGNMRETGGIIMTVTYTYGGSTYNIEIW